MGLVNDDAIEGAGCGALGWVRLVDNGGQRLDSRDLYVIFAPRQLLFQSRDFVNLGKVQHALDFGGLQSVACLPTQHLAVE